MRTSNAFAGTIPTVLDAWRDEMNLAEVDTRDEPGFFSSEQLAAITGKGETSVRRWLGRNAGRVERRTVRRRSSTGRAVLVNVYRMIDVKRKP